MAFGIKKSAAPQFPKRKAEKDKDYLSWLHSLPCVVTGSRVVEAAHLSTADLRYGHTGRGKGTKASDRWCLSLSPEQHRLSHSMNEMEYWKSVGINPHILALTLYGLFSEMGEEATPFAIAVINQQLAESGRLKSNSEY